VCEKKEEKKQKTKIIIREKFDVCLVTGDAAGHQTPELNDDWLPTASDWADRNFEKRQNDILSCCIKDGVCATETRISTVKERMRE
jgi:hypothetical protein